MNASKYDSEFSWLLIDWLCLTLYRQYCHPEKTNVDWGEAEVDIGFEGWKFPMLPSRAVNIYYIILNVN